MEVVGNMYRLTLLVSLIVLVSFSGSWAADNTIVVVPGNYKIKTTTRSNMNPNPQSDIEDQCVTDTLFYPQMALPDESCTPSNVKKSGNKLSFDFKCTGNQIMPAMTGKADVSATSSTLSLHYKMVGVNQGQEFSVDSTSEGKRTGDCK
jgi:hypothetical protein